MTLTNCQFDRLDVLAGDIADGLELDRNAVLENLLGLLEDEDEA